MTKDTPKLSAVLSWLESWNPPETWTRPHEAARLLRRLNGINKDLVAELESLADYLAGQLTAIECPPTDEQSDWPLVHKARAVLAKAKEIQP